jgi:hypothetical protein
LREKIAEPSGQGARRKGHFADESISSIHLAARRVLK